jgi:hypothetical protein
MGTISTRYKFVAAPGRTAPGTASDCARGVLRRWQAEAAGRSFEVIDDQAVYLLASLHGDDAEAPAARERLLVLLAGDGLKPAILPCGI